MRPMATFASTIGSIQATVGGGSSSTIDTASNTNNAGSSVASGGGGGGSNPAQASRGGAGAGGGLGATEEVPEECVICLTDPKNTLLLPCRHLCVCTECFRHVDKCPVCRSAFDNYIVLSAPPQQAQAQAAAAGAAAAAPAVALASVGGGEATAASTRGTGGTGASPALGRTAAIVPLVLPTGEGDTAAGTSAPPSLMPTGVASMVPSASLRGEGRREGEGAGGGRPSSSSSPAAAAGASGAVSARRTIFAVSRRRVAEG